MSAPLARDREYNTQGRCHGMGPLAACHSLHKKVVANRIMNRLQLSTPEREDGKVRRRHVEQISQHQWLAAVVHVHTKPDLEQPRRLVNKKPDGSLCSQWPESESLHPRSSYSTPCIWHSIDLVHSAMSLSQQTV